MTQPVDIDLNLDGNYADQVDTATQATEGLNTALQATQAPARGVQRALDLATPSRAHLAAWAGFTAAAAYWQQQTSGVRATAVAAGQSIRVLDGDVNRLARTFPIGTAGAVQMVQAVQSLGATEKQIGPLANVMERLSGATGFGPELAINFGQLNRELASLDPGRVQRFGDVLTTVAARSGASAMGIVSFAQAIAPVAQQAGIGESAVLGISSAFVKLGEDGGAAATAVNKILGDLNRSVREGSNDMVAYAQITGVTVRQFREMYQTNPAQTVAAVTAAIGRAGPQGQMLLESLGLEGVRTQRSLLQLSQSGGLGAAVNQAVGAYGNNSTATAARQAFGGLNDSLTELRSTTGQTADALGGPFLGALTKITTLAKDFLGPVNAVLGSGPIQHGLQDVAGLAVGAMVLRRVVRPLGGLALGVQALTSGPVRSAAGGYAASRAGGDLELALATRAGQFGQAPLAYAAMGAPYGRGRFMQGFNRYAGDVGAEFGGLMTGLRGTYAPGVPNAGLGTILSRAARGGVTASSMAYEGWLRSVADPLHQAVTPAGERLSLLVPEEGKLFSRAGAARSAVVQAERAAGTGAIAAQVKGLQASLGLVEKEGGTLSAALGRLTSSTMGAAGALGRFTGGTAMSGVRVGNRALGGLASMLGPEAILGGAAFGAYELYKSAQNQTSSINTTMRNTDIYGVQNSWADAVGAASKNAMSMADAMASATNTINASVRNFPAARTVSNADIVAAGRFNASDQRKSSTLNYALGNVSDVQALVQANALSGMSPQDMQGLKISMIRQGLPETRVNQILAGINPAGTGGQLGLGTVRGLGLAYRAAAHSYDTHGHGLTDTDIYAGRDAQKVAQTIASSLGQQQQTLTQQYGSKYATQQTVRSLSELMSSLPSGRRYTLSHALAASLGYSGGGGFFSANDLLGAKGVSIGGMSGRQLTDLLSGPTLPHHLQPSIMEAPLQGAGAAALLPFFASSTAARPFRAGQRAAEYMAAGHEADISAQTKAVNAMVEAATKTGTSLTDLALQATKASSATADWQQGLLEAIAAEAQFEQQVRLQGAGRGLLVSAAVSSDLRTLAAGPGTDPNGFQAKQYAQAKSDLANQRQSLIEYYQSRVMAQYQFQIQSERSQEDYQRQVSRSEEDFQRGRYRALRDFNIQVTREQQDAAKSFYDPYTRITVQPIWDAPNLILNSQEQIQAMRQQIANIHRLRDLGLDEATIRMLGLYAPDKAQQAQELVMDLQSNGNEAGRLNRQTAVRTRLAGQLMSQDPQYQRQRQDFNRNLRDQQKDYGIARSRMETDFSISQQRMAQDLATQDLQITNNMTKLTRDMADIIHHRFVDLHRQVVSSLTDTQSAVNRIWPSITNTLLHPGTAQGGTGATTSGGISAVGGTAGGGYGNAAVSGGRGPATTLEHGLGGGGAVVAPNQYVKPGTGEVYHGKMRSAGRGVSDYRPTDAFIQLHPADPNFNRSIAKRMRPDWAKSYWADWDALWTQESGWNQYADNPHSDAYGIPQSLPGTKMATAGGDWRTNPATQIKWGTDYIAGRYGNPANALAHENRYGWYASGGVFTGPTLAGLGERGPEAAIPLNEHGMKFMLSALRQYVGTADAKLIGSGGLTTATHVHISRDSYTYDQGTHIDGPITVVADSPEAFAQKAAAKKRRDNLTGTRGVRWSRSN